MVKSQESRVKSLKCASFPRAAWGRQVPTLCVDRVANWPQSGRVLRCHAERGNENRSGITLTEVLISMGILTLGLLGVAAMFPVGGYYMQKGDTADRASAIAQSAFNDAMAQGILDPQNWFVMVPNAAAATPTNVPSTKFTVDGINQANTYNRPFAAALNESIGRGNNNMAISKQLGSAYVIDPMGIASFARPQSFLHNRWGYAVPATAYKDNDATVRYYSPYSNLWNTWRDANDNEDTWPIRRVTFPQLTGNVAVPMRMAMAEKLFSGGDDLTMTLPGSGDAPSSQNWSSVVQSPNPRLPLARDARGDYSWFITVVPETVAARNALAGGGGGQAYDVSVVVFYKRVLNRIDPTDNTTASEAGRMLYRQERTVQAKILTTGPSGGEVLLTAYDGVGGRPDDVPTESPFTDLKTGEWMMICGPHPDSTDANPRFAMNWYRILAIEGQNGQLDDNGNPTNAANQPERRVVSLRGPQWPWKPSTSAAPAPLSNWLCGGIFPGAVAVHNRTIQLESSTAFGGSSGGGGMSTSAATMVGH